MKVQDYASQSSDGKRSFDVWTAFCTDEERHALANLDVNPEAVYASQIGILDYCLQNINIIHNAAIKAGGDPNVYTVDRCSNLIKLLKKGETGRDNVLFTVSGGNKTDKTDATGPFQILHSTAAKFIPERLTAGGSSKPYKKVNTTPFLYKAQTVRMKHVDFDTARRILTCTDSITDPKTYLTLTGYAFVDHFHKEGVRANGVLLPLYAWYASWVFGGGIKHNVKPDKYSSNSKFAQNSYNAWVYFKTGREDIAMQLVAGSGFKVDNELMQVVGKTDIGSNLAFEVSSQKPKELSSQDVFDMRRFNQQEHNSDSKLITFAKGLARRPSQSTSNNTGKETQVRQVVKLPSNKRPTTVVHVQPKLYNGFTEKEVKRLIEKHKGISANPKSDSHGYIPKDELIAVKEYKMSKSIAKQNSKGLVMVPINSQKHQDLNWVFNTNCKQWAEKLDGSFICLLK